MKIPNDINQEHVASLSGHLHKKLQSHNDSEFVREIAIVQGIISQNALNSHSPYLGISRNASSNVLHSYFSLIRQLRILGCVLCYSADAPLLEHEPGGAWVTFLSKEPTIKLLNDVVSESDRGSIISVFDSDVYLLTINSSSDIQAIADNLEGVGAEVMNRRSQKREEKKI
jgi:hypothetical protein